MARNGYSERPLWVGSSRWLSGRNPTLAVTPYKRTPPTVGRGGKRSFRSEVSGLRSIPTRRARLHDPWAAGHPGPDVLLVRRADVADLCSGVEATLSPRP